MVIMRKIVFHLLFVGTVFFEIYNTTLLKAFYCMDVSLVSYKAIFVA